MHYKTIETMKQRLITMCSIIAIRDDLHESKSSKMSRRQVGKSAMMENISGERRTLSGERA